MLSPLFIECSIRGVGQLPTVILKLHSASMGRGSKEVLTYTDFRKTITTAKSIKFRQWIPIARHRPVRSTLLHNAQSICEVDKFTWTLSHKQCLAIWCS